MAEKARATFESDAAAAGTFAVVRFEGTEGLSRPYEFDILLASPDGTVDLGEVAAQPARLTLCRPGGDVVFPGIVVSFDQEGQAGGLCLYRARLAPRLWWLNLACRHQVFLDQSVPAMLQAVLKDGGLTARDFEFRLQGDYPKRDFVCQYGENHLDFIHRWIAREGIYYFFETGPDGEKVVFTDSRIAHQPSPLGETASYSPVSALDAGAETVHEFTQTARLLPRQVHLVDYHYETPSLAMEGRTTVDPDGYGELNSYGEHFTTPAEGDRLARLRAEALSCRKELFSGSGTIPFLRSGFTFRLQGHFSPALDQDYLVVENHLEGRQTGFMLAGLDTSLAAGEEQAGFRNRFTAIPAGVQFRAAPAETKPTLPGVLPARVDASGSGEFAELDDQGRYKIRFPFDESGQAGGKASSWVRRSQPSAGAGSGWHMPLRKGTEVLLSFTGGDPDRPVILGAVPNPDAPSVVGEGRQTRSVLRSASGNELHSEDQEGSERLLLHNPANGVWVRLGMPNDPPGNLLGIDPPPDPPDPPAFIVDKKGAMVHYTNEAMNERGLTIEAGANLDVHCGAQAKIVTGDEFVLILGAEEKAVLGWFFKLVMGKLIEVEGLNRTHLAPHRETLAEHEHELHTVSHEIDTQATQVVTGVSQTVDGDRQTITGCNTNVVADRERELAEALETLDGVRTQIDEAARDINADAASIRDCELKVRGVHTEAPARKASVVSARSRIGALQQEANGVKTEIENIRNRANTLSTQDAALVTNLRQQINRV